MASFDPAYTKYVQPIEGGYVNDPADKGGETYAGIARNYNPSWSGWPYIDQVKAAKGTIKRNTKFPDLQTKVHAFYKAMWDKNLFGQINNQDVANILFDWYVNSGSNAFNTRPVETFGVQEILNKYFGKTLVTDGVVGPKTIAAINEVNASQLYNYIKDERKKFYDYLVARDASQKTFYQGWLNRLASFPDVIRNNMGTTLIIVGGLIALGTVWYVLRQQNARREIAMQTERV